MLQGIWWNVTVGIDVTVYVGRFFLNYILNITVRDLTRLYTSVWYFDWNQANGRYKWRKADYIW